MKQTGSKRDQIHIKKLRVDCIVGIYPKELKKPQPLFADVRLGLDLSLAGRSGKISATCDYQRVANEISYLLKFRRYRLLEMAAEEIAAMLFGVHKNIQTINLRLEKPRALPQLAKSAAVEIDRTRSDYPVRNEQAVFGHVDILLETAEAGLYLLHIGPGKAIPLHFHRVMRELEWRVSGHLLRNGKRLKNLSPIAWKKLQKHSYRNAGKETATLFCCDVPPFIPEDEILVSPDKRDK